MNFFRHLAVKKTRLPCLVRGFLAYMFSSFLINMQYVKTVCEKKKKKKKCVFIPEFPVHRGEIKGSETFLMLTLSKKRFASPRERYTSFPLVTRIYIVAI